MVVLLWKAVADHPRSWVPATSEADRVGRDACTCVGGRRRMEMPAGHGFHWRLLFAAQAWRVAANRKAISHIGAMAERAPRTRPW